MKQNSTTFTFRLLVLCCMLTATHHGVFSQQLPLCTLPSKTLTLRTFVESSSGNSFFNSDGKIQTTTFELFNPRPIISQISSLVVGLEVGYAFSEDTQFSMSFPYVFHEFNESQRLPSGQLIERTPLLLNNLASIDLQGSHRLYLDSTTNIYVLGLLKIPPQSSVLDSNIEYQPLLPGGSYIFGFGGGLRTYLSKALSVSTHILYRNRRIPLVDEVEMMAGLDFRAIEEARLSLSLQYRTALSLQNAPVEFKRKIYPREERLATITTRFEADITPTVIGDIGYTVPFIGNNTWLSGVFRLSLTLLMNGNNSSVQVNQAE